MSASKQNSPYLSGWLRWVLGASGVAMVAGSILLLLYPPDRSTREFDANHTVIKQTVSAADVTTPFLAIFVAGVALLSFGVNGLRFSKIGAGGVNVEAPDATSAAQGFLDAPTEERPKSEITVEDKPSPEPSEVPAKVVDASDGRYAVFELSDVPMSVITDALEKWPQGDTKPEDLGSFEFATRRTGKGNHPWTLKFKGRKAVVVSYGGQGKAEATVAPSE